MHPFTFCTTSCRWLPLVANGRKRLILYGFTRLCLGHLLVVAGRHRPTAVAIDGNRLATVPCRPRARGFLCRGSRDRSTMRSLRNSIASRRAASELLCAIACIVASLYSVAAGLIAATAALIGLAQLLMNTTVGAWAVNVIDISPNHASKRRFERHGRSTRSSSPRSRHATDSRQHSAARSRSCSFSSRACCLSSTARATRS
jgi:hypothetical protein